MPGAAWNALLFIVLELTQPVRECVNIRKQLVNICIYILRTLTYIYILLFYKFVVGKKDIENTSTLHVKTNATRILTRTRTLIRTRRPAQAQIWHFVFSGMYIYVSIVSILYIFKRLLQLSFSITHIHRHILMTCMCRCIYDFIK